MLKAFKYRLYPTSEQEVLINKHIGAVRFVYNLALETKIYAYSSRKIHLTRFDLQSQLPELKQECEWLKEINSGSLQVSIMHLDNSYKNFFSGKGDFPKFKKKLNRGSFNIPQRIQINNDKLSIPKFREGISITIDRPFKGAIRQATLSRTPTGKYYASILCDTGEVVVPKRDINCDTTIGLDLGIKSFIVTSNRLVISNPKFLREAQSRLKYIQRKYSKYKGKRTRSRLSSLYEKVGNQRSDFLHKTSSELIKNHDSLAIETLRVSNMLKNHNLAQSISDAGWSMFVNMLEYKAEWHGKNLLKIGAFEPSSKTCSDCGQINKGLTLSERSWLCQCGSTHDRDINAAINIKNFALKNLSVERRLKNQKELPTMVGALTSEAETTVVHPPKEMDY